MSNRQDLEKLIKLKYRRLHLLKEQATVKGINTPPEVTIEIEDLQAELETLNAELIKHTGHPLAMPAADLAPVGNAELKQRFPGLVVLVGPGRKDGNPAQLSHIQAIEHHLNADYPGDPLRVCWLIATAGNSPAGAEDIAKAAVERYRDSTCNFVIKTVPSAFDMSAVYRVIQQIYTDDIYRFALATDQVITDITGGTKPMSAGMILACGELYPMQFMQYTTRANGEPASVPVIIRFE